MAIQSAPAQNFPLVGHRVQGKNPKESSKESVVGLGDGGGWEGVGGEVP